VLGLVVGAGFEPARHGKQLILFATILFMTISWWFDWLTFANFPATPNYPTYKSFCPFPSGITYLSLGFGILAVCFNTHYLTTNNILLAGLYGESGVVT